MPRKKKLDTEDAIDEMLEAFPSNSKASKTAPIREQRMPEIIEEGANIPTEEPRKAPRAYRRKKTLAQSVAQSILGAEAKGVVQHILYNVLLPAAKDMISDSAQSFIEMLLFGEARPAGRHGRDKGRTTISYGSMYESKRDSRREVTRSSRDRFGLEDIFFPTPKLANDVLEEMGEMLEEYEWVTVADYLDLAGVESSPWINSKWGWNSLKTARCIHTREGYAIILPDPEPVE